MNEDLLYYPYINVPKEGWTIKSTLYFNSVSTITPYELINNPSFYNNETKDYFDSGLLKPLLPSETGINIYQVNKQIIDIINLDSFNLEKRQKRFAADKVGRIHKQKFTHEIFAILKNLKLCTTQHYAGWYYVEKHTANLMMVYLTLAISSHLKLTPSTDQKYNLGKLFSGDYTINKKQINKVILNEILPYPKDATPFSIARFKEKYYDSLVEFRNFINEEARKLGLIEDLEIRKEELNKRIKDIIERRDYITAKMNESKFKKVVQSSYVPVVVTGSLMMYFETLVPLLGLGINSVGSYALLNIKGDKIPGEPLNYLGLIDKKLTYGT